MRVSDVAELAGMTTPEKILALEDLWDSISSDDIGVPVPQSHKAELDRRFRDYQANPGKLLTLKELQARIAKRK